MDIEVNKSLVAPELTEGTAKHKTLVKITPMLIGGGNEVINVGTHYQILVD